MPQWYVSGRGWMDERGRFGTPKRRNYAWIWPNDRNRGTWGRFTDIMTGKGPDMYIAMNPNRKSGAADGPSRKRWTNYPDFEQDKRQALLDVANYKGHLPGGYRFPDSRYDFRTRRYRRPYAGMWGDVERLPGSKIPSAVQIYPNFHNWHQLKPNCLRPWTDPKNFAQNTVNDGMPFGGGGYWHPQIHGYPFDVDDL